MRYLKIKDDLYLVQKEIIEETNQEPVQLKANHIFIIDRSGSMCCTLKQLIEDLIERCKQLPIGDTVTVGWFSTKGEYNWIIKGFKITEDADYTILENLLRKNNTVIGLTCFSEILADTKQVVEDLKVFTNKFSLCFLSDGYPIPDTTQEELDIFKAIKNLNGGITSTLLVGYGNYYNKELMSKMAQAFGGSLTHSSDLQNFKVALVEFLENTKDSQGRIKHQVPGISEDEIFFSLNGTDIICYQKEDNHIQFLPSTRGKNWLYFFTNRPDVVSLFYKENLEEIKLTDSVVKAATSKVEHFLKGIYAASYILTQKCKNDLALAILETLGDKYLIDRVSNAFTNEEYGKAEEDIKQATSNQRKRFINGRDTNHLPPDDTFCLLDLFDILRNDEKALFYPMHTAFKYNRIGIPSIPKEGYPNFEPDTNSACRISDLVWNKTMLNLSMLARIPGIIRLKNGYKKIGLHKVFDTFVWRNYTVVKDGFLNITRLPVSFSADTAKKLFEDREYPMWKYDGPDKYILDLSCIPIINRNIAKKNTSAKDLFEHCIEELELQALIKVLKYMKDERTSKGIISTTGFENLSNEQIEYLMEKCGLDKNGAFSPPCEKMSSTDYYFAKEFKISIDKFSSLPGIEKVKEKIKEKKKLTVSEELIYRYFSQYNRYVGQIIDPLGYIEQELKNQQLKLKKVRSKLQKTKFAIILGNSWFDEFPNREECSMELNGYKVNINLDKKRVNY